MQTPLSSPPWLAVRPFYHLRNLWMVVSLFIAVKAAPSGGVDKATIWGFLTFAILLITIWWVGHLSFVRRFFEALLGEHPRSLSDLEITKDDPKIFLTINKALECTSHRLASIWWMLAGLLFVGGLLAYLEWRQPFYFVQDDNLSQFLPVVLQGCRSLLHEGAFPTWNPHQFLGSPTTSLGTYALTYPPTYISYAIADGILGNEYATFDVFCIVHLLAGYCATFWACRVIGVRPSFSAAASACFALAGFFLIAGRSWYYMTPVAVWTPLLVGMLEKFRQGQAGGRWVLVTGGILGLLFHAGNAQMWSYAVLFYLIAIGFYLGCREISWSQIFPAMAALIVCLAISAPLLVAQYVEISGLPRRAGDGSMLQLLPTIFLPFPFAKAEFPGVPETPHFEYMGHMSYSGTVFSVVAALGMLSFIAYQWNRRTMAANLWLLLAWVALLFTFGRTGGLWYMLARFPPFSSFKHPFKFIGFVTLFMVIGGAVLWERALQHWKLRRRWEIAFCLVAAVLMAYHVSMATPSFCDYAFRPFPELPAEMRQMAAPEQPQRIYSIAPRRCLSPQYAFSMMHQLPTVWGCYALEGYDPLISASPRFASVLDRLFEPAAANGLHMELGHEEVNLRHDKEVEKYRKPEDALKRSDVDDYGFWGRSFRVNLPRSLKALKAYGVRWVVIYSGLQTPQIAEGSSTEIFWKIDPVVEQLAEEIKERCTLVMNRPGVSVYELKGAAPLSFAVDSPRKPLPVTLDARGLSVDTSTMPAGGQLVVNVVPTKFLKATADGKPVQMTTDRWGRLLFELPPGTKCLTASYHPPWLVGAMIGGILAAFAAAVMRYRHQVQRWVEKWSTAREGVESLVVRFRRAA